jgi:uncharacterized protein
VSPGDFEWDPAKNRANRRKHGVSFEVAATIFEGPCLEGPDARIDYGEERIIAVGRAAETLLVVVYCWRNGKRRLISARRATRPESAAYWETAYGESR